VPIERHLVRAKGLADSRFAERLTVQDMAQAAGLSRSRFSRALGEPPHVYLFWRS
jgi:AraC-like DNA-binding protein